MRDPTVEIQPSRPTIRHLARLRRSRVALALVVLAVAGAASWRFVAPAGFGAFWPPARQDGLGRATQQVMVPPVPVTIAAAARRDFAIALRGIGTVQAYNTVTVKSRVDGELQQVLFREGQDVRQGDVLAQIDPRPFEVLLRQAEAAKARDVAQLDTAQRDFARSEALVDRGFTTRQTYDTQKNQIAQSQAALLADDAAIDNARLQLSYARIVSPLGGRTGVRLVDAGNMIRASDPGGLVTITQLQPISVVFTLPQELFGEIAAAMRVSTLAALATTQDNKRVIARGALQLIDNAVDQATGTIRLKANFPNDDEALWPGQFVNVRLAVETRKESLVVAAAAVQRNQDGTYAWVIRPDGTAEVRPIKIATVQEDTALVSAGLKEGEQVVIAGHSRLRPGAKVVPSRPANVADAQTDRRAQ